MNASKELQTTRPIVIVSNRGPISFAFGANDEPVARRASGGLATAIGNAVVGTEAVWIAASLSDADNQAAQNGLIESEGFRLRLLAIDPSTYSAYYNTVANGTLWFLNHGLFDAARRPRFDRRWHKAWESFREVNAAFAQAVAAEAPRDALVLVHDYHLSLIGAELSAARPDITSVYFHHTPFCGPDALNMLPDNVSAELMNGLAGFDVCGFHSPRWAKAFEACATEIIGSAPKTFVSPAAGDARDLMDTVNNPGCQASIKQINAQVGTRKLIVRVDRIELSKNLLRGFLAFQDLLENHPECREQVVFVAFVYPSREGLAEYLAYRLEVEGLVRRINDRWRTPDWEPIIYDASDDYPRSIAALCLYDVLLVNPIRDGLNLVAKEGPLINQSNGVLVLSKEAGVWDELGDVAIGINPYDIAGTSDALHTALSMEPADREHHATSLRQHAGTRSPHDWYLDQIQALDHHE